GATRLDEVANEFFLHDAVGNGPSLKFGGTDVVAGEFGGWTPIGAEKTAGGYGGAWKDGAGGPDCIWNTHNNANFVSMALDPVPGASAALKAFEPSFHQDLNRDGAIG